MSVQVASAAQAVGEHLQSPDDLLKIAAFRRKLEKEKASIDAKLKNGVKDQLDATRDGLRKLLSTRNNVQVLKDEMSLVDRMCSDPLYQVKTFEAITRVSLVHRNFAQTEEMVKNLTEMYSKLDMLEGMLADERDDILGPAPNLLAIHFLLNQLEAFRNETLHQAKKASADARATLGRYFERLNAVIDSFDEHIWTLARNVLPIVRAGNGSAIVKLVKIAEIEGKEDEKAIAIKVVKKAANQDAASKFKSMQANARIIKHYRSKMNKCIADSVKEKFDQAYERDKNDPQGFLDSLNWIYQDIIRIESDVVPCFPSDYDIFSLYVRKYHKTLDETIKTLIDSNPEASTLLVLHAWLKEYKESMKELNVPEELLEPPLLSGKEQGLIDDYVQLIITKLDEWTANLMKDEIKEFTLREQSPEQDGDGLYGMQGAVIMFQMVNQQMDAAVESGQGAVLARVVTECNRAMRGTQDQWSKLVDAESKKQMERPEEAAGGLVDYMIALANDQIKCADYAEALSARLEARVSEKYRAVIAERLNNAIDGYLDVAKKCTQTLIDLIFNDLKPATKQLFGAGWYSGIMRQIIETMSDYMTDYQAYLNPTILELLVEDLLDTFLITYLNALARVTKLKMPAAADRIRDDVSEAFTFFAGLKPPAELEAYFKVIELVLDILTGSKAILFSDFWNFAQIHGPQLAFIEVLIRSRDDLDRTSANEVMESIKRQIRDKNIQDPPEPTIMKKVIVPGAFQRFVVAATAATNAITTTK